VRLSVLPLGAAVVHAVLPPEQVLTPGWGPLTQPSLSTTSGRCCPDGAVNEKVTFR